MNGDGDDHDVWMMNDGRLAQKIVCHAEMLMLILTVHALVILSVSACSYKQCRDRGFLCCERHSHGVVTFRESGHDVPFRYCKAIAMILDETCGSDSMYQYK